jgi:hypothetical protein
MNATDLGAVTRRPVTHAAYFDDFERWCEECVTVADKLSGLPVPFRLNAPQKRLARVMEARRRAGRPVRVILLKARQWGGSALCYLLIYLNTLEIQPVKSIAPIC